MGSSREHAEKVWDTRLSEAITKDPSLKRFVDELWGDVEIDRPGTLVNKRRTQRDKLMLWRNMARDLQGHDRVASWTERLRSQPYGSARTRSFLELVDPGAATVARALRQDDQAWFYPAYQHASNLMHGSTLIGVADIGDDVLLPSLFPSELEMSAPSADLRRFCHNNVVLLERLLPLADEGLSK